MPKTAARGGKGMSANAILLKKEFFMKHILKLMLAGVLAISMLLCACDQSASDDDLFGTSEATKKPSQTAATTAPTIEQEIPTDLKAEIEVKNQILARSTKNSKPVVTPIGNTGVEIELSYYAWPTICRGEGDTLYAAASIRQRHIDPYAATAFFISEDNGETWSEPRIINNTPVDDRDTGIVYIGNGKMLISFFTIGASSFLPGGTYEDQWGLATEEQKNAKLKEWNTYSNAELALYEGAFVLLSDDYGETWSEPIKVPVSCPHGPTLLNDGRTLMYPGLHGSKFVTYISRDFGKTWSLNSELQLPKLQDSWWGYWETYVIQLRDGSYLAGIRTGTTGGDYIGGETLGVLTTTSLDGKNWEPAVRVPDLHGAPPHFLELDNGVVVLAYSYRWHETTGGSGPIGSRARLSYDGGKTWSEEEIRLSENVSFTNYDLGYPSSVQLDDGTIYTIYYQPWEEDTDCSVIYTKWKLVPKD